MKKQLLLAALCVGLATPAFAQSDREPMEFDFEKLQRCEDIVKKASYKEQYDHGKFLAQVYNTVRKQKWWTAEEREEFNPYRATSRHGLGGISGQAEVAWMMWDAKRKKRPFKPDLCITRMYSILEEQAWSAVHEGFYEYLADDAQKIYFKLPAR